MITHNIGIVRKLIAKRKEVLQLVKTYLEADNVIVGSVTNNQFAVQGRTEDTATLVMLLGRILAVGWEGAQKEYPDIKLDEYLVQPTSVALGVINKESESA